MDQLGRSCWVKLLNNRRPSPVIGIGGFPSIKHYWNDGTKRMGSVLFQVVAPRLDRRITTASQPGETPY